MRFLFFFIIVLNLSGIFSQEFFNRENGKTYFLSPGRRTYEQMTKVCLDRGMQIVQIESLEEHKWIDKNINGGCTWLGVQPFPGGSTPTHWADGTPITWFYKWRHRGKPNTDLSHIYAYQCDDGWGLSDKTDTTSGSLCQSKPTDPKMSELGKNTRETLEAILDKLSTFNQKDNLIVALTQELKNERLRNNQLSDQLKMAIEEKEKNHKQSNNYTLALRNEIAQLRASVDHLDSNTDVAKKMKYDRKCRADSVPECSDQCGFCPPTTRDRLEGPLKSADRLMCCARSCVCAN